ncbi:2-phospho-L-lactate transferase [Microbacterium sp. 4R-513]|uniref:2-phospho-L-lactate transferase n=1 Tax=Microbacterium sp. 4R-513 TaxID=2567934 RepID=UPI0013E1C679|nr:2-phospho-L-lactate transferase [Microbacterium sp. 4R-513]QIG39517.1 2-phospho-L-lactate transferase [Microbacterium sp. 4R-513]
MRDLRNDGVPLHGLRVVLLAGGAGGSTFAVGLRDVVVAGGGSLTVVCNTADDLWVHGLRIQPDVDSMLYGLAGVKDPVRGWGRAGDSDRVSQELREWNLGWDWFALGDLDLGTHIARSSWLREGAGVGGVVHRLQERWELGARLLPMTESEVDTLVMLDEGTIHFQEWWTRHRAQREPRAFANPGIESARPAPGVLEALAEADVVVLAPSNPVVSIGPIVGVPGIADAIRGGTAPVVGVSPIIGGSPVRGMADVCLRVVGAECSAAGVAQLYGARDGGGLLDAWLLGEEDAAEAPRIEGLGIRPVVTPLWMSDVALTRALAADALAAALTLG